MPKTTPDPGYELAIGDRAYSSWSLRGWLMFDAFDIPVQTRQARLYSDALPKLLQDFAPARTVPALRLPASTEGQTQSTSLVIGDSLALTEELASRHPQAGHWPKNPAARAVARALSAEMHSGFAALRQHCAMNLRLSYQDCAPPAAVLADLQRLQQIWAWARQVSQSQGPWLCGDYSAVDAYFAPVAGRIAGHNLGVDADAMAYVEAHLTHPSFRRWRAMAMVDGADQPFYLRDWPQRDWPGPKPLAAEAVSGQQAENALCPYSGQPVSHVLLLQGRRFGFCNAFCRDKTAADPAAWPAFMALLQAQ